jgi:hypothetical protein
VHAVCGTFRLETAEYARNYKSGGLGGLSRSMKTINRLGFVFSGGNYIEQVHRVQHQPHISTRSRQSQTRTTTFKGFECPYNAADARGIHLRHIGQIEQNLVISFVN